MAETDKAPMTFEELLVDKGIDSDTRLDVTDARAFFEAGRAAGIEEAANAADEAGQHLFDLYKDSKGRYDKPQRDRIAARAQTARRVSDDIRALLSAGEKKG